MAYDLIETSVDDSVPVELYQFKMATRTWCRTNIDTEVIHLSERYTPYPISRSDLKSNGDASLSGITVKVPGDDPIAIMFIASPPSETVTLTLFSNHFSDAEVRTIWKGRVLGVSWDDEGYATLTCESIFSSQQRAGLRRRCNVNCEFALYGNDCGVSEGLFQESVVISGIIGNVITITSTIGKIDNFYAGGELRWPSGFNIIDSRTIKSSNGTSGQLILSSYPIGVGVGTEAILLPGCDHTYSNPNGCGKFNNKNRYGGAYRLPDANKNPFGGTLVY